MKEVGKLVVFFVVCVVLLSSINFLNASNGTLGENNDNPLLKILYDYAIPFALLISYTLVALGFMVSKIFNSREAEGWAKLELREVLISTMYGALIISFFPVFNSLTDSFSSNTVDKTTEEVFEEVLTTSFVPFRKTLQYSFTFSMIQFLAWAPSATTYIKPWPYIQTSPFYEHRTYLNFFNMFTNTFLPILFAAMISIMGQLIFLNFFEQTIFIFIGLGLFLRSFTLTRKIGGTLLAIVLGIFFLLKLLMVIESTLFITGDFTFPEDESSGFDKIAEMSTILLDGVMKLFNTALFPTYFFSFVDDCTIELGDSPFNRILCMLLAPLVWVFDLIIAFILIVSGVVGFVVSYLTSLFSGIIYFSDLIDTKITSLIAIYADVITFAFFMPILNIVIVIAGIKSLAETFGGDPGIVNMLTFL
jgi:hypothetical protein